MAKTTPFIKVYKNGNWINAIGAYTGGQYSRLLGVHNGTEWVTFNPNNSPRPYGRLYNSYIRSHGDPNGLKLPTSVNGAVQTDYYILLNNITSVPSLGGFDYLWLNGALDSHTSFGTSGFKAVPTGRRVSLGFFARTTKVFYLTASDTTGGGGIIVNGLEYNSTSWVDEGASFNDGFPIRYLVTDSRVLDINDQYTDLDGNVYDTVTIGTQTWLVQDWRCTKYPDGSSIPNVQDQNTWNNLTTGAYCDYIN